jgi:ribosome-associated protein
MPQDRRPAEERSEGQLVLGPACIVPTAELEWRFDTSGGPGGQHANVSRTRVEVRLDLARSASIGEPERSRLIERLGPVVTATAADTRSQARNRAIALQRLRDRLGAALVSEPPRQPGAPAAASKRLRLEDKARRSETKRLRRPPSIGTD